MLAGGSAVCGAFGGFGGVVSFGFACGCLVMGVVGGLSGLVGLRDVCCLCLSLLLVVNSVVVNIEVLIGFGYCLF